ncbi:MAG: hypothetical protein NVS2B14_21720 [Chamaesiphon sp.]
MISTPATEEIFLQYLDYLNQINDTPPHIEQNLEIDEQLWADRQLYWHLGLSQY